MLGYVDKKTQVDVIILDFSKAFDVVSHRKLLAKLENYGIRGELLIWIKAFLTGRTQQVVVNGRSSTKAQVESGVPQGTCLGPVLFLCYINDIVEGLSSSIRLFADDALLYRPIESHEDHLILENDLDKLSSWAKKWDMCFNTKKCQTMSVCQPNQEKSVYFYTMCGEILGSVSNSPYLGVTINDNLTFDTHISKSVAKASRMLGFINRTLRSCPPKLKELAYFALCRSNLEYASQIWDPPPNSSAASAIERIQRRAARFVVNDRRQLSSVTEILRRLDWEPLSHRRTNQRLVLMHQIHNDLVSVQFEPGMLVPGLRSRYRQIRTSSTALKNSYLPYLRV